MSVRTPVTTDHGRIRRWVEDNHGVPSAIRGAGGDNAGVLGLDFSDTQSGVRDAGVEHISWDEWFARFDEADLALLYNDDDNAERKRFFRIVRR